MSTTMDMEEQQPSAKKSRMDDPSSKEESTENVIQNDGAEENGALREKLREAEQKAQMAKNELEKIIEQSNTQKAALEAKLQMAEAAHLAEKIALLEEKQIQEKKYSELETKMRNILTTKVKNGNPAGSRWNANGIRSSVISSDGLQAKVQNKQSLMATGIFPISAEHCRKDPYPFYCTIYYYEVTQISHYGFGFWAGLSNGNGSAIPRDNLVGWMHNSYSVPRGCDFYVYSGRSHNFKWPEGAIKPEWKGLGDVVGCGILIGRNGKLALFFTLNGILLGRQIPLEPGYMGHLFPTVTIWDMTLEANFGHDLAAKPFMYDIEKCPGLDLK